MLSVSPPNDLERFEQLRSKLAEARRLLPAKSYDLRPCLAESALRALEREYAIELPVQYVLFITRLGNGGWGPTSYPIHSLAAALDAAPLKGRFPACGPGFHLFRSSEIPTDAPYGVRLDWLHEQGLEDDELRAVVHDEAEDADAGYLPLGTDGCGLDHVLVLDPEQCGEVWLRCDDGLVRLARSLFDWYERALDREIARSRDLLRDVELGTRNYSAGKHGVAEHGHALEGLVEPGADHQGNQAPQRARTHLRAGRYGEALDLVETSRRRCLEFFEDDDYSFELELLRGAAIAGLRGHERSSRTLLETYDRDTQWTGEAVRVVREYLGQRQKLVERTLRRTGLWTPEGVTEAFASVDVRGLLAQERELAFARCDEVLRVIPDCPSVLYAMASAHLEHNAIERATACLDRVPDDSGYRQNLYAIASEARGDFEQAVVHAEMALTQKPGYYVIRDNLGSFLARAGNPVGAAEIHSEIIAAEPDYAWAYANMAGALALQCRPDEALRFLGEALVRGYPPWRVAADSALDALRRDGAYRALLARCDGA